MISKTDLQALVEVHVDDGKLFGDVSKEVRTETGCGFHEAINLTIRGLTLAEVGGHTRCAAVREQWLHRSKS